MGRPRKPRHLKLLEGNRGKRDIMPEGTVAVRGIPAPPAHWPEDRQYAYLAICEELHTCGAITLLDGPGLELLLDGLAEYRYAGQKLAEEGYTSGEFGDKVSPWWRIRSEAAQRVLRMLREYGMTPSGRASLGGTGEQPPTDKRETDYFSATA